MLCPNCGKQIGNTELITQLAQKMVNKFDNRIREDRNEFCDDQCIDEGNNCLEYIHSHGFDDDEEEEIKCSCGAELSDISLTFSCDFYKPYDEEETDDDDINYEGWSPIRDETGNIVGWKSSEPEDESYEDETSEDDYDYSEEEDESTNHNIERYCPGTNTEHSWKQVGIKNNRPLLRCKLCKTERYANT